MRISIVMPFDDWNADIERSLLSLKSQSYDQEKIELVIINACSDENLVQRIDCVDASISKTAKIINISVNSTRSQMLNTGVEKSSGSHIMFLRPGDAINTRLLDTAKSVVDACTPEIISYRATYAHDGFDMFEDDPLSEEDFCFISLSDNEMRKTLLMNDYLSECFFCHIYSKDLIDEVGIRFEDEVNDEAMVFTYPLLLLANSICYTQDHGYCVFCGNKAADVINQITEKMKAQARLFELLKGSDELYSEYRDIIDAHFIREYFISNLKKARGLDGRLPLPVFEVMQYVVLNLVPKWIENDYIFALDKDDRQLMCLIGESFKSDDELNLRLKDSALVSVITTTYNRGDRIRKAIECILRQSYQYFEYIIVNDGSTDETESIVSEYNDSRIKYIKNDRNRGVSYSRNVGVKSASAKYIVFQDDDDFCRLDKLEKTVNAFFKLTDNYGMVYCESINHSRRLAGRTDVPAIILPDRNIHDVRKNGYIFPALLSKNFITATAAMMRKDYLEEVGMYDESLFGYEDWDTYLRITSKYEAFFIREPLYDYYQREGTLINGRDAIHRSKILKALYDIDQKYLEDRKRYGIETYFKIIET